MKLGSIENILGPSLLLFGIFLYDKLMKCIGESQENDDNDEENDKKNNDDLK